MMASFRRLLSAFLTKMQWSYDLTREYTFNVVGLSQHRGFLVLDAGCGHGQEMSLLSRGNCNRVIGVDITIPADCEMVHRGRLVRGSLLALPFADNAFDCVFTQDTLHHIEPREKLEIALNELVRVTGNKIYILEINRRSAFMSLRKLMGRDVHNHFEPCEILRQIARQPGISISAILYLAQFAIPTTGIWIKR